ncbi:uncharacterized protein [Apostichopus japonicus]|uniref:uncharacterized protein isoform X2 n=1 Tax=Stichopus japonicus TaxID=307972 RepID=UPI003AB429F1
MCFSSTEVFIIVILCETMLCFADRDYLGCFSGNFDEKFEIRLYQSDLSHSNCSRFCAVGSYTHFGLENGTYCHCRNGDDGLYEKLTNVSDIECNTFCAGAVKCGGEQALAVYQGNECLCEDVLPSKDVHKTSCFENGVFCSGAEKCGGSGRIAIWKQKAAKRKSGFGGIYFLISSTSFILGCMSVIGSVYFISKCRPGALRSITRWWRRARECPLDSYLSCTSSGINNCDASNVDNEDEITMERNRCCVRHSYHVGSFKISAPVDMDQPSTYIAIEDSNLEVEPAVATYKTCRGASCQFFDQSVKEILKSYSSPSSRDHEEVDELQNIEEDEKSENSSTYFHKLIEPYAVVDIEVCRAHQIPGVTDCLTQDKLNYETDILKCGKKKTVFLNKEGQEHIERDTTARRGINDIHSTDSDDVNSTFLNAKRLFEQLQGPSSLQRESVTATKNVSSCCHHSASNTIMYATLKENSSE